MDDLSKDEIRFAEKIRVEGDCWIWLGALGGGKRTYAYFTVRGKTWRGVRWAYTEMIGEIPEGLTLDHLCRRPDCVNPFHCEPVSLLENIQRARPEFCIRGHRLSGDNVYVRKDGRRNCKTCQLERSREIYWRGRS